MNIYHFLLQFMSFLLPLWRTGSYIISGITVVAASVYWIKNRKQIYPMCKNFKIVTSIYLFCIVLSILFSQSYKIGFYYFLVEYAIILFFPFVVWPLFNEKIIHRIIWLCAFGLFLSSIIIIYQGYGNTINIRPNGFIGHMNYAGAVVILVPVILSYLHGSTGTNKKNTFIGYFVVALAIIGSIYNGTRAIFVDLAAVGVIYALLFWKPTFKQVVTLGATIGILFLAVGTIKSGERIKDINPNTMSVVTRLQMWEIGYETWQNNRIFGVGVGLCPSIELVTNTNGDWQAILAERKDWNDRDHLHNLVIQTITEIGLVGLAGMLSYWGYILVVFLKNALKQKILFARVGFCGVLGFLCHNMTDYAYGITSEAILVSIIITLAFSQINKKEGFN